MPNLKNSISSSVAQHPVLFKLLAICYLQRPVPELRLCAGTLRITRSQRPALGHLAIGGGGGIEGGGEGRVGSRLAKRRHAPAAPLTIFS